MPKFSLSPEWLASLPADFYDHLAHCLALHGMACAELFARPATAITQQLTALTSLDAATVATLNSIVSQEQLVAALRRQPQQFYDLLLVGRLGLETSVAEPVLGFVQQQMQISRDQLATLTSYCLELSETFLGSVEQHLAETDRAGAGRLGQHRLLVEEAFFTHLGPGTQATPQAAVATVRFNEPQLQMVRLAVLLVHSLPQDSTNPFLRAVVGLQRLHPALLEPVMERLGALQAGQQLDLSLPQLVQLYQAMQVCGLIFVSDVLATLGLEDFLPTADPADALAAPATAGSSRQAVGEMVSGFTAWVQQQFGEAPEIQVARQEIAALAELV